MKKSQAVLAGALALAAAAAAVPVRADDGFEKTVAEQTAALKDAQKSVRALSEKLNKEEAKARAAGPVRGLPGHYYPGPIDKAPDVDCGVGRRLTYWGVDLWVCTVAHDGRSK